MPQSDTLARRGQDSNSATASLPDLTGLVSSARAATVLGVTQRWVGMLAEQGAIPFEEVRLPGAPWPTRLFRMADLERIAAERKRRAVDG